MFLYAGGPTSICETKNCIVRLSDDPFKIAPMHKRNAVE